MTGVSMGIDRLVPLLERMGVFKGLEFGPKIYIATATDAVKPKGVEIAQMLRRAGIPAELDLLTRGLRKQLDNANRKGCKKVVIVGERELQEGYVSVRDMVTSEQLKVKISELTDKL
jgi:histidyl-tRNA synthetase